jgi:CheY-like chemotaxis protein
MVIFYANDDKDDRELFGEVVKEIDPTFTVIHAKDGLDAVRILSKPTLKLPDIIFLDINMPMMDGYETLVELGKINDTGTPKSFCIQLE